VILRKELKAAQQIGNMDQQIDAFYHLGYAYSNTGKHQDALNMYLEAIELAKSRTGEELRILPDLYLRFGDLCSFMIQHRMWLIFQVQKRTGTCESLESMFETFPEGAWGGVSLATPKKDLLYQALHGVNHSNA